MWSLATDTGASDAGTKRKKGLVVRLGALGDMIQTTCVFPYFHAAGYDLTLNCDERGLCIVEHNPFVSDLIVHKAHSIPKNQLWHHWKEMGWQFDKVAFLSGTVIEGQLLFTSDQYNWYWKDKLRRKKCNKNYCEELVKESGFVPQPPVRGQVYFSKQEREAARRLIKRQLRDYYVMIWAHSGSAVHKCYLHYGDVIFTLLREWPDLFVIACGDEWCQCLDDGIRHERVMCTSGLWDFRQAMAIVPYVDLVVGPETGLLNAAGCFSTPKICLLSHSSKENLTKHWENDFSIQAPCECSPCHRLFKYSGSATFDSGKSNDDFDACPRGPNGYPACMEALPPEQLIDQIMTIRKEFDNGLRTTRKTKKRRNRTDATF